ncbi:MAG: hypothetical protein HQL56_03705 [Magnetococcales bacterium]|nr:hypothetical protein [Magnetococcales bacterium]
MSLVTEAEAKKKWCPMVRVLDLSLQSGAAGFNWINTVGMEQQEGMSDWWSSNACKGSLCMFWRWKPSREGHLGYCGLAGKPDD